MAQNNRGVETQEWAVGLRRSSLSKAELAFDGLVGAVEAIVEAGKHLRELEQRYQANEAAFSGIRQNFQQIQESAGELQSLTEERLAALSSLNVELKARHAQGEQTLYEVKQLLEQAKIQQSRVEQAMAASETRQQADAGRIAELGQMQQVIEALVEQLQTKQAQMEQSLMTVQAVLQDQAMRLSERESALGAVKSLAEQTAEKQAQADKALTLLQNTQQAEKSLIAHLEKSLNTVRTMTVDFEKRLAQTEIVLASMKASGSDATMIGLQSVDAVRELMQDLADRQSAMQALLEEVQKTALRAADDAGSVSDQLLRLQKASAEALQGAQLAQAAASEALQKVSQASAPPAAAATPEQQQAAAGFEQFLHKCAREHQAAVEQQGRLQAQLRKAVEDLPAQAEPAIQKFLEQSRARIEQMWSNWFQHREQRVVEMESRYDAIVEKAVEMQKLLEQAGPAAPQQAAAPEWAHVLEQSSAAHSSELRFVKTLLWITLAAVGLAYALVTYAVILRPSS
jgi:hypothetical protein